VPQASAEALPLGDDSVDAAMAIFSDHHWEDRAAGMRELRRIARERVVLINADPALIGDFWLARDYLPGFARIAPEPYRERGYWAAELRELLGEVEIEPITISADCRDGFCGSWWRRPEAYFDESVPVGISVFQVLPEAEVREGLARLRADLDDGTWARRNAELLERERPISVSASRSPGSDPATQPSSAEAASGSGGLVGAGSDTGLRGVERGWPSGT
jgi:hypothetical protein